MPLPAFNFNELNKQQQLAILIGVPVLVAIALLYMNHRVLNTLGADPVLPKFVQRQGGVWAQIRAEEARILEQEAIIAQGPKVEQDLKNLQAEIKLAEERLPTEAEKSDMRELIAKLAREIPAEIGTVQFKAVKITEGTPESSRSKSDNYQTIIYQTEIEGDMNGIIKYIDSIEKNPRFMNIKALSIKPGAVTLDEPNQKILYALHSVSMDIVTYIYNPVSKARAQ